MMSIMLMSIRDLLHWQNYPSLKPKKLSVPFLYPGVPAEFGESEVKLFACKEIINRW
jgi:hypothetical protein